MILKCYVLLCLVSISFSYMLKEGKVCAIKIGKTNIAGECKTLSKCPYAMKILYDDEKKPPMCAWDDDVRIVCCPLHNLGFVTGIHGRFYDPTSDGVKRSRAVTCRYDGTQHQCCPNKPDIPLSDEKDCPPLDNPRPPPNLSAAQLIAWNKCVENQRFVKKCIAKDGDPDWLIRVDTCNIPTDRYRIFGGIPAKNMEFPHMAVLGVVENSEEGSKDDVEWVGGGSLISDRFILTAAHVLIDPRQRPLRFALLGVLNKTDIVNGMLYNIVRKIAHPLYSYSNRVHDIALLELDRRVTLSEFIRPICLPVPGQRGHASSRDIAGWGQNIESGDASQILYTAQVSVQMDYSECESKFETSKFHYNSSTMLCAKGKIDKPTDSCHGDSGGPLMMLLDNIHCSYSAEGVVSFGPHCGQGSAGVYTKVDAYLPWIVQNVWPQDWERATMSNNGIF
ncbi:venom protease-like [Maniola jurtina]|uniref:venom protease-like n=1 Tax=Maniola jurtina TaxID=191418 RepID=UPI001E68C35F|nr:venom protease-like [Maniola jurtina]